MFTPAKKRKHIGCLADIDENDSLDRTAVFVPSYTEEDDAEDFASYTYFVGLFATRMTQAFTNKCNNLSSFFWCQGRP